jgi:hypothetical protein
MKGKVKVRVVVTREQFDAYRRVQGAGKYNMITDADKACRAAGLDMSTYMLIIEQYDTLSKKYGEPDDA